MKIGPNNKLYVRRGDSHELKIRWLDSATGEVIPLHTGDKAYFTVKENMYATDHVLQKVITSFDNGIIHIILDPVDTESLNFFEYVYDVQVTQINGYTKTIIPDSDEKELPIFAITGEVTYDY